MFSLASWLLLLGFGSGLVISWSCLAILLSLALLLVSWVSHCLALIHLSLAGCSWLRLVISLFSLGHPGLVYCSWLWLVISLFSVAWDHPSKDRSGGRTSTIVYQDRIMSSMSSIEVLSYLVSEGPGYNVF